jgi:hypothetical protein
MENPTFIGVSLSDVKVIMVIMRVLMEELPCQAVMGHIPILECLLSGTRGLLWLRLVLPGIKWHRYLKTPALWPLTQYSGHPRAWLPRARASATLGCVGELDLAYRW